MIYVVWIKHFLIFITGIDNPKLPLLTMPHPSIVSWLSPHAITASVFLNLETFTQHVEKRFIAVTTLPIRESLAPRLFLIGDR